MNFIDSNLSMLLGRAMDAYTLRHRITSANIANIDTPGYNKHVVEFEQELQRVQEAGGGGEMKEVTPTVTETDQDVLLEDEMVVMADTQIRIHLVTRSLRHHFNLLRTGITGINR
jgi:flagellar basal-body rod protein FlgB